MLGAEVNVQVVVSSKLLVAMETLESALTLGCVEDLLGLGGELHIIQLVDAVIFEKVLLQVIFFYASNNSHLAALEKAKKRTLMLADVEVSLSGCAEALEVVEAVYARTFELVCAVELPELLA